MEKSGTSKYNYPLFFLILTAIGILLRLHYYFANPSLFQDEAWVIADIRHQSIKEILFDTKFIHPTPAGFNLIIKLASLCWGWGEFSVRLFPFLASLTSLLLFKKLLSNFASHPIAAIMAYGFFIFSEKLIIYAAMVKPYASDMLVTLSLYLLLYPFLNRPKILAKDIPALSFLGASVMWLSFPALFVLAGLGLTLTILNFKNKQFLNLISLGVIFSLWSINFIVLFNRQLAALSKSPELIYTWEKVFPAPGLSWQNIKLSIIKIIDVFTNPGGFNFSYTAMVLFLIGCLVIFRLNKIKLWFILSPMLVTLLAFAVGKYPFQERLVLFLLPLIYFTVSEGIYYFVGKKRILFKALGILTLFTLSLLPLGNSLQQLRDPDLRHDLRSVMKYFVLYKSPQDVICMNFSAQGSFWYYLQALCPTAYQEVGLIADEPLQANSLPYALLTAKIFTVTEDGRFNETRYPDMNLRIDDENLEAFPYNARTWVLFSGAKGGLEAFMLKHLDTIGRRISETKSQGSSLYLYDLSLPRHSNL